MIKSVLFASFIMLGFPAGVWAEPTAASGPTITQQQVITIISNQYGGRVLEIKVQAPPEQNLDFHYRVKMLNEGRVRVLHVNGSTGEVQ